MNRSFSAALFAACLILLPIASMAAGEADVSAERARIGAARAKVEGEFKEAEKACYKKFAVTDCIDEARVKRRDALSDVRRQELIINDAERKRRAAERMRAIEEKSASGKATGEAGKREKAVEDQAARDERSRQKKGDQAAHAASAPAKAVARQTRDQERQNSKASSQASRAKEAADQVRQREEKLAEAARKKQDRDKRLAERTKKLATPLPTPP
ncbi:MAG: hypothetical protein H7255_14035 [Ramlibacter sp.]|nr:hypothetical protein [Ramlibacter sp.]